jgi:hypothetical protein
MDRWTATYDIDESPGFALISGIPGPEAEAKEYAEAQVGTNLRQWNHDFHLLRLRGVNPER